MPNTNRAQRMRPKCWQYCQDCGARVWVSRAQQWRRSRPHCPKCGSTRLDEHKPEPPPKPNSAFEASVKQYAATDHKARLAERLASAPEKPFTASCASDGRFTTAHKAMFRKEPTAEDITATQLANGYHPAGYGGPNNVEIVQHDQFWYATWTCSGNCD